jgi:hypothetical protein
MEDKDGENQIQADTVPQNKVMSLLLHAGDPLSRDNEVRRRSCRPAAVTLMKYTVSLRHVSP